MTLSLRAQGLALGLGTIGALAASWVGLPAAALIGSSLVVAVAAGMGLPVALHPRVRDVGFAIIGISLGSGVGPDVLEALGAWSVSLAGLVLSLLATLLVGAALLQRLFGFDRGTAVLSSAPGTLSNAIAMALEGRGDPTTVTVMQVIRLLVLVTVVPPVATALDAPAGVVQRAATMEAVPLIGIIVLTLALGIYLAGRRVPAACLLTGMVLSAGAHITGLAHGAAPVWLVFAAFAVTGTGLGCRLTSVSPRALLRMAWAGGLSVLTAIVVSLAFAAVVMLLTDLPMGQIWIAYAPGGLEAMAAIGLALGYDPAYVALHHFARILILVLMVPVLMRNVPRS